MNNLESELDRKPVSCSCKDCAAMCKKSPCIPTPAQVKQLIAAGYKDQLRPTMFDGWKPFIFMCISPEAHADRSCVFLINDLCTLHDKDLKPLEGRLAHHDDFRGDKLRYDILKTWISPEGYEVLRSFGMDHGTPEEKLFVLNMGFRNISFMQMKIMAARMNDKRSTITIK